MQDLGELNKQDRADVALAFQDAVVETLSIKCRRALRETGSSQLVVAGGVSANISLRTRLQDMVAKERAQLFVPALSLCTDNGAMIAYAGWQRLAAGEQSGLELTVRPRWPIDELSPPPTA